MSTLLTDFASPAVVRALGWTLLHAIWQAGLLALVLAGGLRLLRPARATTRYALTASALLLLPVLTLSTFSWIYEPAAPLAPLSGQWAAAVGPAVVAPGGGPAVSGAAWAAVLEQAARTGAAQLEPWLPVLVAAWTLGLGLMLLRLTGGLVVVSRLRRVGVVPAPGAWQAKVQELATRLRVGRGVRVLESSCVAGPVVVGWVRPAVLLPVGLLAGLPAAQLEAILAHELAHIRRHDYALNLLQAIIEAIFFFHPAVWWMSAQVRREREHCCDDLAVRALGGNARPLAQALAALATWAAARPVPGPATLPRLSLAATGGELLQRVRRLLVPAPQTATRPGAGVLAGGAVVGLALLLTLTAVARGPHQTPTGGQAAPAGPPEARESMRKRPLYAVATLAPAPVSAPDDSARKVRTGGRARQRPKAAADNRTAPRLIIVKDKKNRVREVYADGQKVPADRLAAYQPYVDDAVGESAERRREKAAQQAVADAREALKKARREARRTKQEAGGLPSSDAAPARDLRVVFNGPRAEINGRVIRLDSLERRLNDGIERAFQAIRFDDFHFAIADSAARVEIERRAAPTAATCAPAGPQPPLPPVSRALPPLPPMPPPPVAPPIAPRAPKTSDAKARQAHSRETAAYNRSMAEYNQQMAEYSRRMEAYGRRMAEYGRRMEEYGRQQARAGRAIGDSRPPTTTKRSTTIRIRSRNEAPRHEQPRPPHPAADPKRLGDELRRDGLIDPAAKEYRVQYENRQLRINDQVQPEDVREKYRKLLKIPENDADTSLQFQVSE